jgi:hypothetical protein
VLRDNPGLVVTGRAASMHAASFTTAGTVCSSRGLCYECLSVGNSPVQAIVGTKAFSPVARSLSHIETSRCARPGALSRGIGMHQCITISCNKMHLRRHS